MQINECSSAFEAIINLISQEFQGKDNYSFDLNSEARARARVIYYFLKTKQGSACVLRSYGGPATAAGSHSLRPSAGPVRVQVAGKLPAGHGMPGIDGPRGTSPSDNGFLSGGATAPEVAKSASLSDTTRTARMAAVRAALFE